MASNLNQSMTCSSSHHSTVSILLSWYTDCYYTRSFPPVYSLVLPPAAWNGPSCLSFFYHMRGWHIGELQVILRSSARVGDEIVWYLSGHQSDDWLMGMVTVAISTNDKVC